jgi:cytochrome b involved in lipid metabolism
MAQVATHNTASDCWTVVSGKVYDVTSWEDQHPGGAARIIGMCGVDATTAFQNQHGSQTTPNTDLSGFQIGTLS